MDKEKALRFYGLLAALALAQIAVAVSLARAASNAPLALFEGLPPSYLKILVVGIITGSVAKWLDVRLRGKPQLAGPWWRFLQAKLLFQVAMLGSLPLLALAATLSWVSGASATVLLVRACFELLVGGVLFALTLGLCAQTLSLLQPRAR